MRYVVIFLSLLLGLSAGQLYAQSLDMNDQTGKVNDTVSFTISINNAPNAIGSLQFEISYDTSALDFTDNFTNGSLVNSFYLFKVNEVSSGQIRVVGITTSEIASGTSGEVVKLDFTVKNCASATLTLINLEDKLSGWSTGSGQFTCAASTPTPTPKPTASPTPTARPSPTPTATATPITVPEVIEAEVSIKPETINLMSKGKFKAFIRLPSPYNVEDIDPDTVTCEGASAIDGNTDVGDRFIATFKVRNLDLWFEIKPRTEFNAKKVKIKLTVSGELKDGTRFEGSDTVTIKSRKYKLH